MRIDLQRYTREVGTVTYDNFIVSDESDNYRLKSIGEFHNDPGPNLGNAFVGSGFGLQVRELYALMIKCSPIVLRHNFQG